MTNLSVPYSSQWDSDATISKNDCGASCIKMILAFYGENHSTDEIQKATGAGSGLVSIQQMLNAIASFGFKAQMLVNQSTAQLKQYIDNGMPPIALVHMGDLGSRQDKSFSGGHFLLPVGYYADGYFVNDPDFSGNYRSDGNHHNYLNAEFEKAWGDCHIDSNPDHLLVLITPKAPVKPTIQAIPDVIKDDNQKIDLSALDNATDLKEVYGVLNVQTIKAKFIAKDQAINSKNRDIEGLRTEIERLSQVTPPSVPTVTTPPQEPVISTPPVETPPVTPSEPVPTQPSDTVSIPVSASGLSQIIAWLLKTFVTGK